MERFCGLHEDDFYIMENYSTIIFALQDIFDDFLIFYNKEKFYDEKRINFIIKLGKVLDKGKRV